MLEQEQNKRVCQTLVELNGPLRSYYTYASRTCRSADGCEKWIAHMAADGIQTHFRELFDELYDFQSLEKCGFMVHEHELKGASQGDIVEEGEYANLSGMLALHSIAARAMRLSWLTIGWPQRLNRCLSGNEMAEDTINELKRDHLMWQEFFLWCTLHVDARRLAPISPSVQAGTALR
jgi:hypothetical protein